MPIEDMDKIQWYRVVGHLLVILMVLRHISACTQTLTNMTGSFSTPNYPSNYDNDADCSWTVKVPKGYVVTLQFTDFKVERTILCAFACVCDYIEVHDLTVNGVEKNYGRFCMSNPPPQSFVSTSHQLKVTFHSDYNIAEKGFKAVYTASPKGVLPPTPLTLSTKTGRTTFTVTPSNETLVTSNSTTVITASPATKRKIVEATSSLTEHPKTTQPLTNPAVAEANTDNCKDCFGGTTTNENPSIPSCTPDTEGTSRMSRWTIMILIMVSAVASALFTVLAVVCLRKKAGRPKSKMTPTRSTGSTRFSFTSAFEVIDLHCNNRETDLVVQCPIYEGTYARVAELTKGTDNPLYESSDNTSSVAKRAENPLYDQVM